MKEGEVRSEGLSMPEEIKRLRLSYRELSPDSFEDLENYKHSILSDRPSEKIFEEVLGKLPDLPLSVDITSKGNISIEKIEKVDMVTKELGNVFRVNNSQFFRFGFRFYLPRTNEIYKGEIGISGDKEWDEQKKTAEEFRSLYWPGSTDFLGFEKLKSLKQIPNQNGFSVEASSGSVEFVQKNPYDKDCHSPLYSKEYKIVLSKLHEEYQDKEFKDLLEDGQNRISQHKEKMRREYLRIYSPSENKEEARLLRDGLISGLIDLLVQRGHDKQELMRDLKKAYDLDAVLFELLTLLPRKERAYIAGKDVDRGLLDRARDTSHDNDYFLAHSGGF